jgi:hypothetical protein
VGKIENKNFKKPDEVRKFPHGQIELVNFDGKTITRSVFQPGWRWSTSVKPIAKTESCQFQHFTYQISGVLRVKLDDGTEFESHPGDVTIIPPGHDGWVVGNEPAVFIDFEGMQDYAKPK